MSYYQHFEAWTIYSTISYVERGKQTQNNLGNRSQGEGGGGGGGGREGGRGAEEERERGKGQRSSPWSLLIRACPIGGREIISDVAPSARHPGGRVSWERQAGQRVGTHMDLVDVRLRITDEAIV